MDQKGAYGDMNHNHDVKQPRANMNFSLLVLDVRAAGASNARRPPPRLSHSGCPAST